MSITDASQKPWVVQTFSSKTQKNRFLRGQGGVQKMAQKHGQNVIFSFCTEEKVDKKWAKPSHLPGVFWFSRMGHFFDFFMVFHSFYHFIVFVRPHSRFNESSHIDYKILNSVKSVVKSLEPMLQGMQHTFYGFIFWGARLRGMGKTAAQARPMLLKKSQT